MTGHPTCAAVRLSRRVLVARACLTLAPATLFGTLLSACGRAAGGQAASTGAVTPTMGPGMSAMAVTPLGTDAGTPVATDQVTIDNFSFRPRSITVAAGTTVTWINHDDVPHTVTSRQKLFGSQALDTDEHFAHRFDTPGTYAYYCAIHPIMTGVVTVN